MPCGNSLLSSLSLGEELEEEIQPSGDCVHVFEHRMKCMEYVNTSKGVGDSTNV